MSHRARKRFGQNFLHERWVIRRILDAIRPQPGETLVEIGPGRGALTLPLLDAVGRLVAIELDRDLVAELSRKAAGHGELELRCEDALRIDFRQWAPTARSVRVVGNLPYNVATPILFHLLGQREALIDLHLLLQREVVQRMAAPPGGRERGRLSVMVQYACEVERLFDVAPGAFTPAPRVTSSLVRLRPRETPLVSVPDEEVFERLVATAFSGRRKTLRNTLRGWLTDDRFEAAGVDPTRRAETLEIAEFAALARLL